MCGRYSLGKTDRVDWGKFGVAPLPNLDPHWNIAPGTDVVAIRECAAGREATLLRWGLIPSWAKDPSIGNRLANARAETAHEKPAYRSAFKSRRCLLPADGFYEWQVVKGEKRKQPWRIEARDGGVLALGALWESWRDPGGETHETCTVLTVPVNKALAHIHDRMPLIVAPCEFGAWLARDTSTERARELCDPAPEALLAAWPIGLAVNTPTNDDQSVAEPIAQTGRR
jgi:putative SOS response-associated peptidase YedK